MHIRADVELAGLEEVLRKGLHGFVIAEVELTSLSLIIRGQVAIGPLTKNIQLSARVESRPSGLLLSNFELQGAGFLGSAALGRIRQEIAELDRFSPPFHLFGLDQGERLEIVWRVA